MSDVQIRGPIWGNTGGPVPFTAGNSGAQRTTDAHGRYMDAVLANRIFFLSGSALGAAAYGGAAAGQPMLAVHNPANSGKIFSLVTVVVGIQAASSANGLATFSIFGGPSVIPTATATAATSMLSLTATGSASKSFVNVALTGSTALPLIMNPLAYYWTLTTSGQATFLSPSMLDIAGQIVVAPGNQIALGASAVLTAATYNATMVWEEIPFLL